MTVSMKKDSSEKVAEPVTKEAGVKLVLKAHTRYMYNHVLYMKKDTYEVSATAAKSLLALRTDMGAPVFMRASDIKPKPIPKEDQPPQVVSVPDTKVIAGMPAATAKQFFNVTTEEEEAKLNAELEARASLEEDAPPPPAPTGDETHVEV